MSSTVVLLLVGVIVGAALTWLTPCCTIIGQAAVGKIISAL